MWTIPRQARGVLVAPVLAILVLLGCETPDPAVTFPDLRFDTLAPIRLNVARIEVVERYAAPRVPPNVEHRMPLPPADAVRRWVADRLVAVGSAGRAVVTVDHAAVVEVTLESLGGVQGALTTEQSERYDATLLVSLRAEGPDPQVFRAVTAEARYSKSVPEDISLNGRRQVWFEITEKLMREYNYTMTALIQDSLGPFVVR